MFGFNKRSQEAPQPAKTVKRQKVGKVLARMFTAGKTDRLSESWGTMPMTADDIVRRNQRVLVARSREQAANNDYAKKFIRMCHQNIVGPKGVQLQAQSKDPSGKLDTLANKAIEQAWIKWGHRSSADVTGQLSWRSLQKAAIISAGKDGEFFFLKVTGTEAGPFGFSLQVIDPQKCPVDFDQQDIGDGRFIRAGIEFTSYGRPVAYYFTTTREQDADYSYGGTSYKRIVASRIIHGFLPEIIGQKRGLPWMATALHRMKHVHGFEESAIVNARVSASKGGFFEWAEGYGPEDDEDEEIYMEAEAGAFQELPAGVRFKEWNPQYPNGEFLPFHKSMLRGISSGLGVAYNNLASDLEGVNFSSIRQGTLDERDHWKDMQEWLIEVLIEPVFEHWLPIALLNDKIKVSGKPLKPERLEKYMDVEWQPRRWQWIDPRADVKAAIDMKNNLMGSPGQFIRDQGRDPQTVYSEIARDIDQMKDAGIPEEFIQTAIGIKMGGQTDGGTTED